jgi:hypothetical protein
MLIRLDKASNSIRRSALVTVLAVAAAGGTWLAVHAKAQNEATVDYLAYGVMGITAGQTVRLNAVSVGVQNEVPVELLFFDSQGAVIGRFTERVAPGRTIFLDARFSPGEGIRQRVRGVVRWGSQAAKGGYVIPSLEVIDDATGRSTVVDIDGAG